jgi:hypothetical protein
MGFLYSLLKDLIGYFKFKDEDKLVEFDYPTQVGISDKSFWCNPEKLDRRLKEGYEVFYEKNIKMRKRYRFINKSNQILLLKPSDEKVIGA